MRLEFVIALAVIVEFIYILGNVFRNADEKKAARQRPGQDQGAPRPRPQPTNVDQFLEEINRRRREAAQRPSAEPTPPARVRPTARSGESLRTRPSRTTTGRPPAELAERKEAADRALAAAAQEVKAVARILTEVSAPIATLPTPAIAPAVTPIVTRWAEGPVSPALARVMELLATKQALPAAVLLGEIFGQPRCLRRYRPGPFKR